MSQTIDTSPLERRLSEACDALWDMFVDPRDAYVDDDGAWWNSLAVAGQPVGSRSVPFASVEQLTEIRQQSRRLATTNEFAINGIENRTSYLVGSGHVYRASVRKGAEASSDLEIEVQTVLDEFMHVNRWQLRQQETVRRLDRDGKPFCGFLSMLKD